MQQLNLGHPKLKESFNLVRLPLIVCCHICFDNNRDKVNYELKKVVILLVEKFGSLDDCQFFSYMSSLKLIWKNEVIFH